MPYTPILATLGYVTRGDEVLLIHRNARPEDTHLGKYNGLGGKLDALESPVECMRRELAEEAEIQPTRLILRGTVSWPGFGKQGEDWFGFIYLIPEWAGTPPAANPEGALSWQPVARLLNNELPLWEGDKYFLPLVFDQDARAFDGIMPYKGGKPVSWRYERL
ncbi:MAG: ADP-ribose pyrophosphatase [Cyanobacteria bacterium RYN_339]|nr:ADP-ribose pyrophosphatase [Cyanobacteria bacterium RYN_339]